MLFDEKIEKLYYMYRNLMFTEAYRILNDKALAEDAVSESFVRIFNNVHKIDADDSPCTRNFLVVVCRNVAKDIYNSQKRESSLCRDVEDVVISSPEDIVIDNESVDRIAKIISTMDDKYKDVLILSRVYKLERNDIAKIFGISPEAVTKRLQRAKKKIKQNLGEEEI